jgi:hypothetical protein
VWMYVNAPPLSKLRSVKAPALSKLRQGADMIGDRER